MSSSSSSSWSSGGWLLMGKTPPLPPSSDEVDPRMRGAWRSWLVSLATDAEAAIAAALIYAELPPEARDAWLDALEDDLPGLDVPHVAVYGPLLTVESDPKRLTRVIKAARWRTTPVTNVRRALFGTGPGGVRMAALVLPLYLEFVRIIVCRFIKDDGFEWVEQDPIVCDGDAPVSGSVIRGIQLFASSTESVVDELAHAVLAHRRSGREPPPLLRNYADLFSAKLA
jgi:hypothetical protein